MKKRFYWLGIIAIAVILMLMAASCSTNGYGCKGKSRIMTRVR